MCCASVVDPVPILSILQLALVLATVAPAQTATAEAPESRASDLAHAEALDAEAIRLGEAGDNEGALGWSLRDRAT